MSPFIFDEVPSCHGLDLFVGLANSGVDVPDRLAEGDKWVVFWV